MKESPIIGAYYIQQVADITGISKQVIRKWEERYQLIQPKRMDNGYRIYSDIDINTLLTVKALTEQGHSIKQATLLAKTEGLSIELEIYPENKQHYKHNGMNDYVLQLLHNGTHCNEQGMNLTLQQAYHHFGLDMYLTSVIIPFLKEVGHRWEKGQWSEYQESLASLVVRDFLIQIRRNFQYREDAPLIIGACLPYEQHEVPIHIILLQVMMKGWKTTLIGASPAPGSIESFVQKLKPKKVLLSATTTIPFNQNPHLLENLDQFAAHYKDTEFYLGGAGSIEYTRDMKFNALHVTNSIEDLFEVF